MMNKKLLMALFLLGSINRVCAQKDTHMNFSGPAYVFSQEPSDAQKEYLEALRRNQEKEHSWERYGKEAIAGAVRDGGSQVVASVALSAVNQVKEEFFGKSKVERLEIFQKEGEAFAQEFIVFMQIYNNASDEEKNQLEYQKQLYFAMMKMRVNTLEELIGKKK